VWPQRRTSSDGTMLALLAVVITRHKDQPPPPQLESSYKALLQWWCFETSHEADSFCAILASHNELMTTGDPTQLRGLEARMVNAVPKTQQSFKAKFEPIVHAFCRQPSTDRNLKVCRSDEPKLESLYRVRPSSQSTVAATTATGRRPLSSSAASSAHHGAAQRAAAPGGTRASAPAATAMAARQQHSLGHSAAHTLSAEQREDAARVQSRATQWLAKLKASRKRSELR